MQSIFINTGAQDMIRRAKRVAEMTEAGYHIGADAIIFSAIAVEAFPSDFVGWASFIFDREPGYDKRVIAAVRLLKQAESDKLQIKLKYQLLHYALVGEGTDTGANPYQDFSFLIDLRNALVHHKVDIVDLTTRSFEQQIAKIHQGLIQRKLVVRPTEHMPDDWKMVLDESPLAARWAVTTTQRMIKHTVDSIPDQKVREWYKFSSIFKETQH